MDEKFDSLKTARTLKLNFVVYRPIIEAIEASNGLYCKN